MSFDESLKLGKRWEYTAKDILEHFNNQVLMNTSNEPLERKAYDLFVPNFSEIEIKHDQFATLTGNIAIEVFYKGEASGLSTSRAGLWWVFTLNELYIIPSEALDNWLWNPTNQSKWKYLEATHTRKSACCLIPCATLTNEGLAVCYSFSRNGDTLELKINEQTYNIQLKNTCQYELHSI